MRFSTRCPADFAAWPRRALAVLHVTCRQGPRGKAATHKQFTGSPKQHRTYTPHSGTTKLNWTTSLSRTRDTARYVTGSLVGATPHACTAWKDPRRPRHTHTQTETLSPARRLLPSWPYKSAARSRSAQARPPGAPRPRRHPAPAHARSAGARAPPARSAQAGSRRCAARLHGAARSGARARAERLQPADQPRDSARARGP
jgi:hypothetical protein